jgi:hypothetical protein
MAWRPYDQFIEGILDNTVNGKVTGWMRFAGMDENVIFDLEGNFHRDIRGARIRLRGEGESANKEESARYMKGFSAVQQGSVGDMTGGFEPADYVRGQVYIEWYSNDNGRVVILTPPIPACESEPVSRKEQAQNMANFLSGLASGLDIPSSNAIAIGDTVAVEKAKRAVSNNKIRGMKLLPKEIREKLPALYSQDGKGGNAIAHVKFFTPDSNWTWYVICGEPVLNEACSEVDFQFFGLVDGLEKELGYFMLSELEEVRGPMGLPIERDIYWQPKTLREIAPEMFRED